MTAAQPTPRSPAQIEASRRNGARSRGPVTPEGRRRSAMNAMKHGLTADSFTLAPEEDEEGYEELVARLEARFAPVDEVAGHLVQRLASVMWRQYRGDRIEAEVLAQRERRHDSAFIDGYVPRSPLAWDAGRFNAVQRYQARLDRMLFRLLEALDGHTAQGTATAPADSGQTQEEKFPNEPESDTTIADPPADEHPATGDPPPVPRLPAAAPVIPAFDRAAFAWARIGEAELPLTPEMEALMDETSDAGWRRFVRLRKAQVAAYLTAEAERAAASGRTRRAEATDPAPA
jgi:hypothetical protein